MHGAKTVHLGLRGYIYEERKTAGQFLLMLKCTKIGTSIVLFCCMEALGMIFLQKGAQ